MEFTIFGVVFIVQAPDVRFLGISRDGWRGYGVVYLQAAGLLGGFVGASGCQRTRFNPFQYASDFPALVHQVVVGLKTKPEPIGQSEVSGQPQVSVGGDGPLAQDDLIDPPRRHVDRSGETILSQTHGLDEIQQQNLPGGWVGDFVSDSRRSRHDLDLPVSIQNKFATAG
jgi:hypothetical protein